MPAIAFALRKETGFLWWILQLTVELQKETRFLNLGDN